MLIRLNAVAHLGANMDFFCEYVAPVDGSRRVLRCDVELWIVGDVVQQAYAAPLSALKMTQLLAVALLDGREALQVVNPELYGQSDVQ